VTSAIWALVALGCAQGPHRQKCRLEEERVVASSADARLGALAMETSRDGKRAIVAWSDRGGLRTEVLDPATGRGPAPRIVLEGGATALAAVADGAGWRLAAVLPGDEKGGGGGAVMLSLGPDGDLRAREDLGSAGPESSDVAMLEGPAGWIVAWHDGAPGAYAVRVWHSGGTIDVPMDPGHAPMSPSLGRDAEGVAVAWADLTSGEGGLVNLVRLARVSAQGTLSAPWEIGESTIEGADPALVTEGGHLRVIYRDDADRDGRSEYYVADARPRAPRFRVSRANGRRSPSVVHCHGTLAAAAIRSYQGELLVGFNRFDSLAQKNGGELQIYSDGVHFGEASLACLPDGWALAYAEEGERSRVLFNRTTCGDTLPPAR
jgi:hypothetical protein